MSGRFFQYVTSNVCVENHRPQATHSNRLIRCGAAFRVKVPARRYRKPSGLP